MDARGESAGASCALDGMTVDTAGIDAQAAFVLSYDGAPFSGFARQPGQLTVQGEVERALSLALRRPVEVVCAGRTDAGVHARGQVVSFPITRAEAGVGDLLKLKRSMQALTDDAIAVQTVSLMPPDFSARFSAVEREYRYLVVPGARRPLFLRDRCWDVRRELDVGAMETAASLLVGEHDFKSFCLAASAKGRNTVRTLREVSVEPVNVLGEDALSVRIVGTAFLHSMVRAIVGTLVMVGAGLREPSWVQEVLDARDRRAAGENAPAKGLVFWGVRYRGGVPCYERDAVSPEDGGYEPGSRDVAARGGSGAGGDAGAPRAFSMGSGIVAHSEGPAGKPASPPAPEPLGGAESVVPADSSGRREEPNRADCRADDADSPVVTAADVVATEAVVNELEAREDVRGGREDAAGTPVGDAAPVVEVSDEAAAHVPLPQVKREGQMRVNDTGGKPAVPAAPRMRRIAPADPQPAEGEPSIVLGGRRKAPAAKPSGGDAKSTAKRKSDGDDAKRAGDGGGFLHRLFGGGRRDA